MIKKIICTRVTASPFLIIAFTFSLLANPMAANISKKVAKPAPKVIAASVEAETVELEDE